MAVTSLTMTRLDPETCLLAWSGGTAPYSVYRDGSLIVETSETEWTVVCAAGDPAVFEVVDSLESAAGGFPPRTTLYWYAQPGAYTRFEVREYVDAAWTTRARIPDDGRGHYSWSSRVLEDDTSHQFRVIGFNELLEGSPLAATVLMVRYPDVPTAGYTYETGGTGVLTVSDAA